MSSPSDDDEIRDHVEPGLDPLLDEMRTGFADALASLDRILALQRQTIDLLTRYRSRTVR